MTQYRRSASLQISEQSGQAAIVIRDLRISFEVNKNLDKDPNSATIKIYNMSQTTRSILEGTTQKVVLNAGYVDGDGEETVFVGNVTDIYTSIEKPLVVTTIEAQDGQKELSTSRISISRTSGTSGFAILKEILKSINLPNTFVSSSHVDNKYANAFSFSGRSIDAMSKVTDFLGLTWSVQNGQIEILNYDSNNGNAIISLSELTGLIGVPEKTKNSDRVAKGQSTKVKSGWSVKSLLQPKLLPGGRISISSSQIPKDSIFNIISVSHQGDTEMISSWNSSIGVVQNG